MTDSPQLPDQCWRPQRRLRGVAELFFEAKSVTRVSIVSDPYLGILPRHMLGKDLMPPTNRALLINFRLSSDAESFCQQAPTEHASRCRQACENMSATRTHNSDRASILHTPPLLVGTVLYSGISCVYVLHTQVPLYLASVIACSHLRTHITFRPSLPPDQDRQLEDSSLFYGKSSFSSTPHPPPKKPYFSPIKKREKKPQLCLIFFSETKL